MQLTLTIAASDRPGHLARMLDTLLANDLTGWRIFAGIEPGPRQGEVAAVFRERLAGCDLTLTENRARLGVRDHPYRLLNQAFDAGADFDLHLEDDLLLAPDALDLARWYATHARPEWAALNLLAGACGSAANLSDQDHPDLVFATPCFTSIGLGLTRANWQDLRPHWKAPRGIKRRGDMALAHAGWDWAIVKWLIDRPERQVLQPVAARATHAGGSGTHCNPDFQHKAFAGLELAHDRPATYILKEVDDLPRPAAAHVHAMIESNSRLGRLHKALYPQRSWLRDALSHLNRKIRCKN